MVKTPEQYFQDQDFALPAGGVEGVLQSEAAINPSIEDKSSLTPAEQAFLHKYVDAGAAHALGLDIGDETSQEEFFAAMRDIPPLEDKLKLLKTLQMIFFHVQGQLYAVPIEAVQEVVKYMQPMQLPLVPNHIAGVINLRGRVTPLLHLERILCVTCKDFTSESFIIVSQRKGLQIGIIVDKIQTMKTIMQEQISWNVETQIGAQVDCVSGIIDYNDKIFGIISVDKIVDFMTFR